MSFRKGWREVKEYPKKGESNKLSHNGEIARKLWEISEEMTGVKFNLNGRELNIL